MIKLSVEKSNNVRDKTLLKEEATSPNVIFHIKVFLYEKLGVCMPVQCYKT